MDLGHVAQPCWVLNKEPKCNAFCFKIEPVQKLKAHFIPNGDIDYHKECHRGRILRANQCTRGQLNQPPLLLTLCKAYHIVDWDGLIDLEMLSLPHHSWAFQKVYWHVACHQPRWGNNLVLTKNKLQ
jgi:hypothetical protein